MNKTFNQPIITSLLDTDFYKFTMWKFICEKYPDLAVTYELKNRTTKYPLGDVIDLDELCNELDNVRELSFTKDELRYLRRLLVNGKNLFNDSDIERLQDLILCDYELDLDDSQLKLSFSGNWQDAIFWETFALSIINELYYRTILTPYGVRGTRDIGQENLEKKMRILNVFPDIKFVEFGTRRRFSRTWQENVLRQLYSDCHGLLGSSNVNLCRDLDITPFGTMAHELFMVAPCLVSKSSDGDFQPYHDAYYKMIDDWYDMFSPNLLTLLTDTYGSDFTFRTMGKERALKWSGLRQDSGDPDVFVQKALKMYRDYDIRTQDKTIVFSDGLDVSKILYLYDKYKNDFNVVFGWGTDLTNDLGVHPLSLVVKVTSVNEKEAGKLSDNIAKASGSETAIYFLSCIFDYKNDFTEPCKY